MKTFIKRIKVNNLFGTTNYDIDLFAKQPVSIITAPNGCGKTTLLNLISHTLNPTNDTFKAIRSIPFDSFKCVFSNGKTVEINHQKSDGTQAPSPQKKNMHSIRERRADRIQSFFNDGEFIFTIYNENNKKLDEFIYSEVLKETFEVDPSEYIDDEEEYKNARLLGSNDMFEFKARYVWKTQNQYLEKHNCHIPVNFIKADRIQPVILPGSYRRWRDIDELPQKSPLEIASERIGSLIREATEKYNDAVSQAKDKLPQMFIEEKGSNLSCDEFMKGWSTYRKELTQFQEIGLITPSEDFTMGKDVSDVYKDKGKFLSTYLSAFEETTEPLKEIYSRLSLFKQILDERNSITKKEIHFNREGITLNVGTREIPLETLSSGEKHDFIMFYNLIFNNSENGLVLVDEPEISLHVEWQETYLDKLIAICRMNDLQAIVATHSPNIVSSHYDFIVDKGE